MSCWVVPTIAAEIWGLPLHQLMSRIGKGEVPTKLEQGFMFVDVAPNGPRYEPKPLLPHERPQTYVAITEEEWTALTSDPLPKPADDAFDDELDHESEEEQEEASLPHEDPEPPVSKGDWRTARRETARLRIPPPRISPSFAAA